MSMIVLVVILTTKLHRLSIANSGSDTNIVDINMCVLLIYFPSPNYSKTSSSDMHT